MTKREALAKAHASGYKLDGRTRFHGLDISIENDAGRERMPPDMSWKTLMKYPYGYIRGTEGVDGDHVDCYLGPNVHSETVFIIDQIDPETGEFDEQKVMLGFSHEEEAKHAYFLHFDSRDGFGGIHSMPIDAFKAKVLDKANHGKMVKADQGDELPTGQPEGPLTDGERARARGKLAALTMDMETLDAQERKLRDGVSKTGAAVASRTDELASRVRNPGALDDPAIDAFEEHASEAQRSRALAAVLTRRTNRR